jgi:hypothetical protein
MAATVRNIIVGAAQVYLSANVKTDGSPAQTYPANPVSGSMTGSADLTNGAKWRDVGYTTDGLEMTYEPEFGEIEVDQLLDAARLFKQSMRVMIKTTFAEAALENLFVVLNQSSGLSASELEIQGGSLGDYPVERSLVAIGPGPRPVSGNSERVYYASRVMSIESSSHGLKRSEGTFFPVSFRLLPVASTSNAYGKIVDRTF